MACAPRFRHGAALTARGIVHTPKPERFAMDTTLSTRPNDEPAQKAQRRKSFREDAFNIPNLLTMGRIVAIPIVLWLLGLDTRHSNFWAMIIYSVAAITDFVDGWLARRMGLTSLLGKFLDPLADKLFVLAALVLMVGQGRVPAWAVIVIAARELSVTALRTLAMGENVVIAASRGGKDKTAVQMVAVLTLILNDTYYLDWGFYSGFVDLNAVGVFLLYLSVFFTITSAGEYIALFVDAVEAKDRRLAEGTPDPRD
jgi:CDP-diacylglycerol--glycerol-3-phosphate 3-phosphatidyltransferase